jgi:hypothetical protein
MTSLRSSLGVALVLWVLAPALAARAGVFSDPFTTTTICGNSDVAGSMAATSNFAGSPHCSALCRAASASCHRLVARINACITGVVVTNAAFETRNCNEFTNPTRATCRANVKSELIGVRSLIVGQRDASFADCATWETGCQATCP